MTSDSTWAAVYLRKSRDKAELADPDLLHKHRRELLRLADARGHRIEPELIFEEKGSGDLLRSRPECQRLLEVIGQRRRGAGGYLWTTEVSRLTRGSLSDRARVYEVLARPAVIHCTRDRDYDLLKSTDLYYWETETAHARRELGVYRERVAAALLDMTFAARIPSGRPPYGWWWDRNAKNRDGSRGAIRTQPAEFVVVQALCRDAPCLTTRQLATKYGLPQSKVHDLLRNPFICGWPARRHFQDERHRRDNGEPWAVATVMAPRAAWIEAKHAGDYEPACTRGEWEAIQAILDTRRTTRCHTAEGNAWCRDVVRFVGFDRHAALSSIYTSPGQYRPAYRLSGPEGKRIYIDRDSVHQAAERVILAALADTARLAAAIEGYQRSRSEPRERTATDALAVEVTTLERRLDALLDQELDAAERRDMEELGSVRRKREEYRRRLTSVRQQVAALAHAQAPDSETDAMLAALPDFDAVAWREVWEEIGDQERSLVVRGFIEQVTCRVERVEGRWAWYREVEEVRLKPWLTCGR